MRHCGLFQTTSKIQIKSNSQKVKIKSNEVVGGCFVVLLKPKMWMNVKQKCLISALQVRSRKLKPSAF